MQIDARVSPARSSGLTFNSAHSRQDPSRGRSLLGYAISIAAADNTHLARKFGRAMSLFKLQQAATIHMNILVQVRSLLSRVAVSSSQSYAANASEYLREGTIVWLSARMIPTSTACAASALTGLPPVLPRSPSTQSTPVLSKGVFP